MFLSESKIQSQEDLVQNAYYSLCRTLSALLSSTEPRLKKAFLIKVCPLSVVVVDVVVVVVNFSHFHLLLQNHWANFNQTWNKVSLGEGDSS